MGATLFGESRPGTDKIQVVLILWKRNGTGQKKVLKRENAGKVVWGKRPRE
ncbi:hypothetical protein T11_10657 [Trichinella zimbabwensis]|uniref:Uncharacterized protein n=1 Tax=Trichinella zimbabwensis TaxID=268475 RepID=A0A0V1GAR0_9BILA|nr:hypothetical protein T11_10657 [Trichinella zimbabwensis]